MKVGIQPDLFGGGQGQRRGIKDALPAHPPGRHWRSPHVTQLESAPPHAWGVEPRL